MAQLDVTEFGAAKFPKLNNVYLQSSLSYNPFETVKCTLSCILPPSNER